MTASDELREGQKQTHLTSKPRPYKDNDPLQEPQTPEGREATAVDAGGSHATYDTAMLISIPRQHSWDTPWDAPRRNKRDI